MEEKLVTEKHCRDNILIFGDVNYNVSTVKLPKTKKINNGKEVM